MSAKGEGFDLLASIRNAQTPLFLTLTGFRKSMAKHLGLTILPFILHDNPKAVIRRSQNAEYPYGYFRLNSFEIMRDQQAVKTIRRHGSTRSLDDMTNAAISKGYMFPCKLMVELHFIHNEPREVLALIEKASILGAVDGFSFEATMEGSTPWTVGVAMEEGPVEIPQVSLEEESDAAAFDIQFSFSITSRVGVVKSVPKINNQGHVTRNIGVPGAEPEPFSGGDQ
tara:strand:- start:45099 stop:45776 length:678 start_codon:yes stop_codon:yes gene_type:complete